MAGSLGFLVAAVLATALAAYAQQEVGFVANLHGEWLLNSSEPLNPGSLLRAGDTVRSRNPRPGDFIEITDLSGRLTHRLNCARGECNQTITLRAQQGGVISRVLRALMGVLSKDLKSHRVLIARGEGELRESVVKIAGGQVELSSVLANLPAGTYLLRFDSIRAGAAPIGRVRVDWKPDSLAYVTVEGLTPGLHVVRLLKNDDGEPREAGTEAWVLFAAPDRFDQAFCEFREAVALTEEWGASARTSTKRQLLRAGLTYVTDEAR